MSIKKRIYFFICYCVLPIFYLVAAIIAVVAKLFVTSEKLRIVWGDAPIINNPSWARALKAGGFSSESYTTEYCFTINKREDYDRVLQDYYGKFPDFVKYYFGFFESLFKYDLFMLSFTGYFLGKTPYWWLEEHLLRLAGKKIVILPFGLDAYIYRRVRSTALLHGLLVSIPGPARKQNQIQRKVDYWCSRADGVIPGVMCPDGFGRWDVLLVSQLFIDDHVWQPSRRNSCADGAENGVVYITHSPNFRGFKGSEFVINAVKVLQDEGVKVELILIEKMPNEHVRKILYEDTDILVEQLIGTGHGLNGIEGMASGLPVICNLEDEQYILPLRRWSYLSECPLVSASPENLVEVLRKLIRNPQLRHELGAANRQYVEKYHNYAAAQYFFAAVIDYVYERRESLLNFCHPLLGEYVARKPLIKHPLRNNRIPD